MLLLLTLSFVFANTQLPCSSQNVATFDSFWRNIYVNNKIERARLDHYTRCLNQQTSLQKAQEKETTAKERYKDRPQLLSQIDLNFTDAVASRYQNEMDVYKIAFESLSGVDLSNETSRNQFKARTEKLYNYYNALNTCISEDLERSSNPNRLGLSCKSSQALEQSRTELAAAFPAATDQRSRPNPAPRVADVKTILVCQKIQAIEENRKSIACNAKAYCTVYTSDNAPILKGTAISSVAADADHSRLNLANFEECSGVQTQPLCKANYYRHQSGTPENRQFILGNRPEGIIGSTVGFFTQRSCDYKSDQFIIPRIANEYEDGNQFYDVSTQGNSRCNLNWDKYLLAYKRALIREFELDETKYLDCDGVSKLKPSTRDRNSSPPGSGRH